MKQRIKQITATLLAALLLFSTFSFHIDLHFCGDHLVDLSLTGRAVTCAAVLNTKDTSGTCPMAAMECCTDEAIVLQGQDELQGYTADYSLDHTAYFIYPNPTVTSHLVPVLAKSGHSIFVDCSPPPLIRKLHLLHNSFLI